MVLQQLSILNFKNLEQVDIELSPKINCFIGNNGMGKTNLLDAVYYLSFCKSHINPVDSQIIRHDADVCMIQGRYYVSNRQTEEIYCAIRRHQKKQFKRNKKDYDRLSDHIGFIPLVMISPADNDIILGGSDERRRFVDMVISQFDKEYMNALIRYNNALQQRNALLKNEPSQIDPTLLDLWEEQMVEEGQSIFEKRNAFVKQFIPIFDLIYKQISRSSESVSLEYVSQLHASDFARQLKAGRQRDMILGHSTMGVHRDDLEMLLEGYPIRRVGSQGQNKTFFVSLKLAQFRFLRAMSHATPILLLDDIFDRLDTSRVEEIVKLVSSSDFGQIFISDTNRESLDEILSATDHDYHIYKVENGDISRVFE
jgi:DNA replication and repair protein RecF